MFCTPVVGNKQTNLMSGAELTENASTIPPESPRGKTRKGVQPRLMVTQWFPPRHLALGVSGQMSQDLSLGRAL
jgi:hypothetical protein